MIKNNLKDTLLGELFVKHNNETSFFGYHPSVLKSGIQKYGRRSEVEKGLWCLAEMDLFSLLEYDGPALDAYLQKHTENTGTVTQKVAKTKRTNLVNRLIVMMSEEVNISTWWMPLKICELYRKWAENRDNPTSRKYLVDMYLYLISQKKIRLISDIKSVFILPPYYVKPKQMNDFMIIHQNIESLYPNIFSNRTNVGELKMKWGLDEYPAELQTIIKGIAYNLEIGSDHVFSWVSKLCDPEEKKQVAKYKYLNMVWPLLYSFIDQNSEYEIVRDTISALHYFYKKMGHMEKPIYLYHAVLLIVRRSQIDWDSSPPSIDTPMEEVEKLYSDHFREGKMPMDDYVLDIHTRHGKRPRNGLERFALEGAYVENENAVFLNKEYREIYVMMKQELDLYNKKGLGFVRQRWPLKAISHLVRVPIVNLQEEDMTKIRNAPQAQKRTAKHKKAVSIVGDHIFKGPYECDDPMLIRNLRNNYAIKLLEEALQLPACMKGGLPWKHIGCWKDTQYYLVAPNVGERKNIPYQKVTTKIELSVKVVPRGAAVWRVSDIEGPILFADKIRQAALQHLYFRFLLDIGDSGTHNILVRRDYENSGRLIAGIDLEERRAIKQKASRLNHLFKKGPSKLQKDLYEDPVFKIRHFSNCQLNKGILDILNNIGVDIGRLKNNINLWNNLG